MAKYKSKSTEIEAVKFTRDNVEEVKEFTDGKAKNFILEKRINGTFHCDLERYENTVRVLEGRYIVKSLNGDFYICSEDSFESMYERCEE